MTGVFAGTENLYNAQGYLSKVLEADTEGGQDELSVILETDARGHITQERLANGYTTIRTFDPETGRLTRLTTDLLGISLDRIQDLSYDYDALGNLLQRKDQSLLSQSGATYRNLQENFSYDTLNRLTSSQVVGQSAQIITYDGLGNIKSKTGTGTGTYSYGQNGAGPHAVTTAGSTTYQYDANGNNISGDGRSLSYSTFDLPTHLVKGINTVDFQYGADRNRTKRIDLTSGQTTTTLYLGTVEKVRLNDGSYRIKRYLAGGGLWISSYSSAGQLTGTTKQTLVKDHLGSVHTVLSSNSGQAQNQLMSFDSWGQRRNIDSWANSGIYLPTFLTSNTTTRGFTGHEMVDSLGIIHMNGRIYDAKLGRFLQADPLIQAPTNTQSFNRYSYVMNNPLKYVDPSGYSWKLKDIVKIAVVIVLSVVTYGAAFAAMVGPTCVMAGSSLAIGSGIVAGAAAGFVGGVSMAAFSGASFGDAMQAGVKGASSGAVFGGIGEYFGDAWNAKRVGINALAGGVSSKANGDNFADGFRLSLATSLIRVGWEKMRAITNALKETACSQTDAAACVRNKYGEPMTFSNRNVEQIPGTDAGDGNFITRMTEGAKNEGHVFKNNDSMLARSGEVISKSHDWWNSSFSKVFGFYGYNPDTGYVLQAGEMYNTGFQLWSVGGMVPAAIYSGVAMSASAPYLYEADEYY